MKLLIALVLGPLLASCTDNPPALGPIEGAGLAALPGNEWWHEEARCAVCHGAGTSPSWAQDSQSIETISYERRAGYGYGAPGATKIITFGSLGSAVLEVQVTGSPPPEGIGSFSAKAPRSAHAQLTPGQWSTLAGQVAATGLFRFDGVALTSSATHAEVAGLTVGRPGRPNCEIASMHVLDDTQHPTLTDLLVSIEHLERELAWRDEHR